VKSSSSKSTVTIHIKKSDDKEGRWISLSRFQFEALIVLIPASFLSGLVAIGVLMFDASQKPGSNSPAHEARQAAGVNWQSAHESEGGATTVADNYSEGLQVSSSTEEQGQGAQYGSTLAEGNANRKVTQKGLSTVDGSTEGRLNELSKEKAASIQAESTEDLRPATELSNREYAAQNKPSEKAPSSAPGIEMAESSIEDSRAGEPLKLENKPVFTVTQNIKVDDLYNVSTTVFQVKGSGMVSARIGMKNLTGLTESGRVWAKVLVSSGDEEQWLSSHVNLAANDSLSVKEGIFGMKYLFDSWVERELTLGKPRFQVREVKEIILGTETEKHGQKVAKVDLRGSSDNQSGM